MDSYMKFANEVSKRLIAVGLKQKDKDLATSMPAEKYQRTMTDEYSFVTKSRPGRKPVSEEQRKSWELLAAKGE